MIPLNVTVETFYKIAEAIACNRLGSRDSI